VSVERQTFQISRAQRCGLGRANTFIDLSHKSDVRVLRLDRFHLTLEPMIVRRVANP
jgi:hypothetical protein